MSGTIIKGLVKAIKQGDGDTRLYLQVEGSKGIRKQFGLYLPTDVEPGQVILIELPQKQLDNATTQVGQQVAIKVGDLITLPADIDGVGSVIRLTGAAGEQPPFVPPAFREPDVDDLDEAVRSVLELNRAATLKRMLQEL